ncbi:MAG: class I SAM-dependent methyltransferase [Candidatus Competibacteraceae bacterium]|nr:class I SAM-dependent methyltransferase [Candidatus Competibacteraceae bacterium]
MQKWFPLHLKYASEMLASVLDHNQQSEDVVRRMMRQHPEFGKRDRQSILDMFYSVLRNFSYYNALLQNSSIHPSSYEALLTIHLWKINALMPGDDRWPQQISQPLDFLLSDKDLETHTLLSIPLWLYELHKGEKQIIDWQSMLHPAMVYVRANTLRTTTSELINHFNQLGLPNTFMGDECIRIDSRYQLTADSWYINGCFEIQDMASQQVVPSMNLMPGMKVFDACAGNGGKSLHMASVMQNKGMIWASDVRTSALNELMQRAKRAGANIIHSCTMNDAWLKEHMHTFDAILTDVPCTGMGTLKRKPELKWKMQPEQLDDFIMLQREIASQTLPLLKPGGILVYSTCSILEAENEEQVKWFIQQYPNLSIELERRISPSEGGDGFFIARFRLSP